MIKKKVLFTIISVIFCIFNTQAQINLLSNGITFRSSSNYTHQTIHYGDFRLDYSGSGWGWLYCNQIFNYGYMQNSGDIDVYGNFKVWPPYNKNFIQPHPTDDNKVIAYVTIEAGEALTITRGLSATKGGQVEVVLPDHFSLVTSADVPVTVLITPEKSPALLYVIKKSKEKIAVAVKADDYSHFGDVEFSYQVTGVRDGYENYKAIRDISDIDDSTNFSPKQKVMKEKVKAILTKEKAKRESVKKN